MMNSVWLKRIRINHNIKTTESWSKMHSSSHYYSIFCWKSLNPGIHVIVSILKHSCRSSIKALPDSCVLLYQQTPFGNSLGEHYKESKVASREESTWQPEIHWQLVTSSVTTGKKTSSKTRIQQRRILLIYWWQMVNTSGAYYLGNRRLEWSPVTKCHLQSDAWQANHLKTP